MLKESKAAKPNVPISLTLVYLVTFFNILTFFYQFLYVLQVSSKALVYQ